MEHPIRANTRVVTFARDIDYLSGGEPYLVTPYRQPKGKPEAPAFGHPGSERHEYRCDRLDYSSGTSIKGYHIELAKRAGNTFTVQTVSAFGRMPS